VSVDAESCSIQTNPVLAAVPHWRRYWPESQYSPPHRSIGAKFAA